MSAYPVGFEYLKSDRSLSSPVPPRKGVSPAQYRQRKLARLEDPELRRWYDNVARGSRITADQCLRSLFLFTDRMKVVPGDLIKLSPETLHRTVLDFVSTEEKRGQAGRTTSNHVKAVKSWLAFNGVTITRPVKIRGSEDTTSIRDERTPTQEELRRIFMSCRARDRVSAVLMAHSGVRPEVLGNYGGLDGLRLKDFPELKIRGDRVEFDRVPAMVVVRPELSKAKHRYFSFLTQEGCDFVKEYLELRAQAGEKLTPETDLIHSRYRGKPFIHSLNVSDGIRAGIVAAMGKGVKMRPYALRAYFDTQLLLAESRGKVAHDYRVFWMGHKGSMEARYTTNKGRLAQHFLEDMREAYQRCEELLVTTPVSSKEQVSQGVAREMLELAGYSPQEIDKFDLSDKERVRDLVREGLIRAEGLGPETRPRQEIIEPHELKAYVAQGWSFVGKVDDHQVVVNSPPKGSTSPTPAASRPVPTGASGLAPPPARTAMGETEEVSPPETSTARDSPPRTVEQARALLGWNRRGRPPRNQQVELGLDGEGPAQGPNPGPGPARDR